MSLSILCDGDGGRSERCQWQDTDSINTTGPVGARVHGTLRRDVLLAVCSPVGLNTAVDIIHTHIHVHGAVFHFYHNLPARHKPAWQQIKLILDNPPRSPSAHSLPTHYWLTSPLQRCLTKHYTSHSSVHYTGSWHSAGICLWGHLWCHSVRYITTPNCVIAGRRSFLIRCGAEQTRCVYSLKDLMVKSQISCWNQNQSNLDDKGVGQPWNSHYCSNQSVKLCAPPPIADQIHLDRWKTSLIVWQAGDLRPIRTRWCFSWCCLELTEPANLI